MVAKLINLWSPNHPATQTSSWEYWLKAKSQAKPHFASVEKAKCLPCKVPGPLGPLVVDVHPKCLRGGKQISILGHVGRKQNTLKLWSILWWKLLIKSWIYPLVNVYITNWNITMLLMDKSTISTGPCSIATRNKLPEGIQPLTLIIHYY